MTSLHIHYSVPSTILDKNVSSLQQTHSFSLGIATHRSHEHQDVFDRRFSFPSFETESSFSPSSSAALCGCSSLEEYSGSNWYGEICDMFTDQVSRLQRATTIRHQPTVHCALFKMAAAGISKWLKGCALKIEKEISSLGKAFFLYRVY